MWLLLLPNGPEPCWAGFNLEKELKQILNNKKEEAINMIHNVMTDHTKGHCKDCYRIITAQFLPKENLTHDELQDIENICIKYLREMILTL